MHARKQKMEFRLGHPPIASGYQPPTNANPKDIGAAVIGASVYFTQQLMKNCK